MDEVTNSLNGEDIDSVAGNANLGLCEIVDTFAGEKEILKRISRFGEMMKRMLT